jgi:hypothetical protein
MGIIEDMDSQLPSKLAIGKRRIESEVRHSVRNVSPLEQEYTASYAHKWHTK